MCSGAKQKMVLIQISWLLRSQLIWIYTVFKIAYIRILYGKGYQDVLKTADQSNIESSGVLIWCHMP